MPSDQARGRHLRRRSSPTRRRARASASAEISAFVTACGTSGTATTCNKWQTQNLSDGGNTCGDCIFAPKNNGGVYVSSDSDGNGFFGPNFAGCIELADQRATCATDVDDLNACATWYCAYCQEQGSTTADVQACQQAAAMAECKTQDTAFSTDCKTDFGKGGSAATCGATATLTNTIWTSILTEICGSGSSDAGKGKD